MQVNNKRSSLSQSQKFFFISSVSLVLNFRSVIGDIEEANLAKLFSGATFEAESNVCGFCHTLHGWSKSTSGVPCLPVWPANWIKFRAIIWKKRPKYPKNFCQSLTWKSKAATWNDIWSFKIPTANHFWKVLV